MSVVGVGGAGCNAVDNMVRAQVQGVNFFVLNTDAQALSRTICENRIQIGVETTRGLGAGAIPAVGRKSAEEDIESVMDQIEGSQILFLTAGMGGMLSDSICSFIVANRSIMQVGLVQVLLQ